MLRGQGRRMQIRGGHLAGPLLAILAIVISLGGVAFATDLLPARSVGKAQLRNGSVGSSKIRSLAVGHRHLKTGAVSDENLDFVVGSSGAVANRTQPLVTTGHCGAWEGTGDPPPCPPDGESTLAIDDFELNRNGVAVLDATVNLVTRDFAGHTDGTASVWLRAEIDGTVVSPRTELRLVSGDSVAVPLQGFTELAPGVHRVALTGGGSGYDFLDVDVTSAVVTTTVTPAL